MDPGCADPSTTMAAAGDGELLNAFASTRDEQAFAELVRRYSPLVLGTCLRVLGRQQDAEDAGQAVFLTLARQARRLHGQQALGGWLHRVAWRAALDARKKAARRSRHEQAAAARTEETAARSADADLRDIIDAELSRLPDEYRVPFILHHLDGMTKDETARVLSLNAGTVSTRLHRARELLRQRLERRGLAVALASFVFLSQECQAGPAFVARTASLACQQAATGSLTLAFLKGVTSMGFVKVGIVCVIVGLASATAAFHFMGDPAAPDEAGFADGISFVKPGEGAAFAGPVQIDIAEDLQKLGLAQGALPSVAAQVNQIAFVRQERYTLTIELKAGDKAIANAPLSYQLVDGGKTVLEGTLSADFSLKANEARSLSVVMGKNPSGLQFKILKKEEKKPVE